MGTICAALAVLAVGTGGWGHREPGPGCCSDCGEKVAEIRRLVCVMRTDSSWRRRDNAAHALRSVDWQCHPEVAENLAAVLVCDPHEEVREEAAESLAKMAPCLPAVHLALERSARCDPDHATRKWAGRALRNLEEDCEGECSVCGVEPAGEPVFEGEIGPIVVEPTFEPMAPPLQGPVPGLLPETVIPGESDLPVPEAMPSEIPPLPAVEAPFGPTASRSSAKERDEKKPPARTPDRSFRLSRIFRPFGAR